MQRNDDLGELAENIEAPTLVYVESPHRADELIADLTQRSLGLVLVRRKEWEAP